ncbi:MAG: hypothetical protein H6836_02630 [Planctomycetes bacterium]|nr:hypothetical protein [Planctomycetota bacterium]MCB9888446.1 hypothetical protein [Planctomycetota bacterium]
MRHRPATLFTCVVLVACSRHQATPAHHALRIDGSSIEAATESLVAIKKQMSQKDWGEFESARLKLMASLDSPDAKPSLMQVTGMTVGEVLARAKKIEPGRGGTQMQRNERAATQMLEYLHSCQKRLQGLGAIDTDGDGVGEFGFFGELAGTSGIRGKGTSVEQPLEQPLMSVSAIRNGQMSKDGYLFQIFLPGVRFVPQRESDLGGAHGAEVSANPAERVWCAYAWPEENGVSGRRVFFVDQRGIVLVAPNTKDYSGGFNGPEPLAAFAPGATGLDAKVAAGGEAQDGQSWQALGAAAPGK